MFRTNLRSVRKVGLLFLWAFAMHGTAWATDYNFRVAGAAQNRPEITTAGSYVLVRVAQDPTSPNRVLFTFASRIPQPLAGIGRIAFDVGADKGLFSSMSVIFQSGAQMVAASLSVHPYLPNFNPSFAFSPPAGGPLYDPRALQPGDMVVIGGVLGPERSLVHVLNALNQGISLNPAVAKDGLRIGLLAYHLLGRRPDPKVTIMDDAGFMLSTVVAQ